MEISELGSKILGTTFQETRCRLGHAGGDHPKKEIGKFKFSPNPV